MSVGFRRPSRLVAGVAMAAVAVTAAACSSSSSASSGTAAAAASSSSASSTPATVNVGVLPIADVAPLYLGIKQGFFAKQNLTVNPHALQGGAAVASAVVGGSLQFGFGAVANLVLARAHNLPVEYVANGDQAAASASTAWSGILVGANSNIHSIKDLAGKTIASNATQGENELALDAVLRANGVNPSSVHVVVLPFPTMPSALKSGQVDAVTEVEPFVSSIEKSGGKLLSPLFEGMQPGLLVAGYFTTSSEVQSHPGVVKRFVTAINESLDYAQSHQSAVRAIIPTYTKIPAAVANSMQLPVWSSTVNTSSIQGEEQLMRTLGWTTASVSVSQLVWSGAKR